jgi:helix-turn-helix protein
MEPVGTTTNGAERDGIPDPRTEPTVTVPRAGRIFGLSRSSAYLAAQNGQLPTIRIGRRLFVPTAQLLEMLDRKAS